MGAAGGKAKRVTHCKTGEGGAAGHLVHCNYSVGWVIGKRGSGQLAAVPIAAQGRLTRSSLPISGTLVRCQIRAAIRAAGRANGLSMPERSTSVGAAVGRIAATI